MEQSIIEEVPNYEGKYVPTGSIITTLEPHPQGSINNNISIPQNTTPSNNNNNNSVASTINTTASSSPSLSNHNGSKSLTRFKWTKEKSQVAMNLVKYGCKPKIVSVAVGCSLRTAQKFVETVTPKGEGGSFKDYEIRRRGRKSKDVNSRLEAIKEVLSKDSSKTQVEIAADLKVSNTTVCRDLKRIKSWREKREGQSLLIPAEQQNSNKQSRGRKKTKVS